MMPLPIVGGIAAWGLGLVAATIQTVFTWMLTQFVYKTAIKVLVTTGFVVAAAAMFAAVAGTIKGGIIALRVFMPTGLGAATYFLPSNLNTIIAFMVLARVSITLYGWVATTMKRFSRTVY